MVTAMAAQPARPALETIWSWLEEVPDPEIPVISLVDLGVIRDIRWRSILRRIAGPCRRVPALRGERHRAHQRIRVDALQGELSLPVVPRTVRLFQMHLIAGDHRGEVL